MSLNPTKNSLVLNMLTLVFLQIFASNANVIGDVSESSQYLEMRSTTSSRLRTMLRLVHSNQSSFRRSSSLCFCSSTALFFGFSAWLGQPRMPPYATVSAPSGRLGHLFTQPVHDPDYSPLYQEVRVLAFPIGWSNNSVLDKHRVRVESTGFLCDAAMD